MSRYVPEDRRCQAKGKRPNPQPHYAMKGQKVCYHHGGASPGARKKGAQRVALAEATTTALAILEAEPVQQDLDPLEHALAGLAYAAHQQAILDATVEVLGGQLTSTNTKGDVVAHPLLVELRHWTALRTQIASQLMRAGVAERQVRISELQAAAAGRAISGVLRELGHDPTDPSVQATLRRHLTSGG